MAVFDSRRTIAFAIAPVSLFGGALSWGGHDLQERVMFGLVAIVPAAGLRRVLLDARRMD